MISIYSVTAGPTKFLYVLYSKLFHLSRSEIVSEDAGILLSNLMCVVCLSSAVCYCSLLFFFYVLVPNIPNNPSYFIARSDRVFSANQTKDDHIFKNFEIFFKLYVTLLSDAIIRENIIFYSTSDFLFYLCTLYWNN